MRASVLYLLTLIITVTTISSNAASAGSPGQSRQMGGVSDPASAAITFSQLEAQGDFSDLYAFMHPDAQAIIPESAVVGWYRNDFAPLGPGVITVDDVRMVVWTWPVTGVTYPETAVVSFRQPFAHAPMAQEVVHLVEHEGQWRWFFGRSRAFVEKQIATYASGGVQEAPASACDGAAEWWGETNPRIVSAYQSALTLPGTWAGGTGSEELLRAYQESFARLAEEQMGSTPPPAAINLQAEFLSVLSRYESASANLAEVVSGNLNPLAEVAALSAGFKALDKGEQQLNALEGISEAFLDTCQPVVVFVPGRGGFLTPVLADEVGPKSRIVQCQFFPSQPAAQRFFEAAGTADPFGLDDDRDGTACEPGE